MQPAVLEAEAAAAWPVLRVGFDDAASWAGRGGSGDDSGAAVAAIEMTKEEFETKFCGWTSRLKLIVECLQYLQVRIHTIHSWDKGVLNYRIYELFQESLASEDPWQMEADPATATAWARWRDYRGAWDRRRQHLCHMKRILDEAEEEESQERQMDALRLLRELRALPYPSLRPKAADRGSEPAAALLPVDLERDNSIFRGSGPAASSRFVKREEEEEKEEGEESACSSFRGRITELVRQGAATPMLNAAMVAACREQVELAVECVKELQLIARGGAAQIYSLRPCGEEVAQSSAAALGSAAAYLGSAALAIPVASATPSETVSTAAPSHINEEDHGEHSGSGCDEGGGVLLGIGEAGDGEDCDDGGGCEVSDEEGDPGCWEEDGEPYWGEEEEEEGEDEEEGCK